MDGPNSRQMIRDSAILGYRPDLRIYQPYCLFSLPSNQTSEEIPLFQAGAIKARENQQLVINADKLLTPFSSA